MIVLVVDEAQHAVTTDTGAAPLFALKAARDQLNGSPHHGFRMIATGSNRDRLSLLVQGKDQAFLNAVLLDLEPLGDGKARAVFTRLKIRNTNCGWKMAFPGRERDTPQPVVKPRVQDVRNCKELSARLGSAVR